MAVAVTHPIEGGLVNLTKEGKLPASLRKKLTDRHQERRRDVAPTPFEEIGLGMPLTISLRTVYLGEYPDAMPYFPIRKGDILVTSAIRPPSEYLGAARAVHYLRKQVEPRTYLEYSAGRDGSEIAYYSPAATARRTAITLELSLDRDFDTSLFEAFSTAATSAAALPVFAPYAPVLLAAGAAVPLGGKAANLLARPRTFFEETLFINMDSPGDEPTPQGPRVLYGEGDPEILKYRPGQDHRLVDDNGSEYLGPAPYAVITLDGTERGDLKDWAAHAASADIVGRFFDPSGITADALKMATQAASLYNDVVFSRKAAEAKKTAAGLPDGDAKQKAQAQYKAYLKNIQESALRDAIENG